MMKKNNSEIAKKTRNQPKSLPGVDDEGKYVSMDMKKKN